MEYTYSTVRIGGRDVAVRRLSEVAAPTETAEIAAHYADMSKGSLMALAKERNISVTTRMTKAKIIVALEG